MEIIISIKKSNGEVTELVKKLVPFAEGDIISSIESEVSSIKEQLLPVLSHQLIALHQEEFKGEKNQEEERA